MAEDHTTMIKFRQLISGQRNVLFLIAFCLFGMIACQTSHENSINELESPNLNETPAKTELDTGSMKFEHKDWLDMVFNNADTGIELENVSALLPPEQIGAQAAIGYSAQEPELWISVYQFDSNSLHEKAIQELRENLPFDNAIVGAGGNGALLIFGYASPTGDDLYDEFHPLNDLLSAFAGEE